MEAHNFLRFWKPEKQNPTRCRCRNTQIPASHHHFDEGDDSFIDFHQPWLQSNHHVNGISTGVKAEQKAQSFSPIIPIEPSSKPQSTPKLGAFTRSTSTCITRKNSSGKTEDSLKRLSKDLITKYLNVTKYVKVSKTNIQTHKPSVSGHLSMTPASPINRKDDSLLLQQDAIQSAILHCKRSLNSSSAESCWLLRCTTDSSQKKLSNASSTDYSLLSTNYKQVFMRDGFCKDIT
ncbi:hypothetical protein F3Y22_tig00110319pilonHSYRG00252 [Hibiscus syriacus]|uniref:Membrane-associated kinase regulator 5 n=1 Tax=Hibiscus syriacus TaxID=106335 RepID=A0A6A3B635_HIBSY|nr:hypothetical protein F3Y22_tig00110319pilonHSYRG00252 [Hibiscus syriacus]